MYYIYGPTSSDWNYLHFYEFFYELWTSKGFRVLTGLFLFWQFKSYFLSINIFLWFYCFLICKFTLSSCSWWNWKSVFYHFIVFPFWLLLLNYFLCNFFLCISFIPLRCLYTFVCEMFVTFCGLLKISSETKKEASFDDICYFKTFSILEWKQQIV